MMEKEQEAFLSRWSRLKLEHAEEQAAKPVAPPEKTEQPPPKLPPVESLTPESDFRAFLQANVDESLKRAALKKLFSDPRFNVMDGLDTYIDDYTKGEPIPEEMLQALNQAKRLLFEEQQSAAAKEQTPLAQEKKPDAA